MLKAGFWDFLPLTLSAVNSRSPPLGLVLEGERLGGELEEL